METLTQAYNTATEAATKALYGTDANNETNPQQADSYEPRNGAGGVETNDPKKPYDGGNDPSLNKPAANEGVEDPSGTNFHPGKGTSDARPSESTSNTGEPSSAIGTQAKHQGAGRPNEEPNEKEFAAVEGERKETEKEQKKDYGDGMDGSSDPAATGSGESAATGTSAASGSSSGGPPAMGGIAGQVGGPKPETESHGEGTGQKYVKSTGMAADGGDFDVTKPGAGREADRLLEEKGIDRSDGGNTGPPAKTDDDEKTSKPSLKERIKEKLHR